MDLAKVEDFNIKQEMLIILKMISCRRALRKKKNLLKRENLKEKQKEVIKIQKMNDLLEI